MMKRLTTVSAAQTPLLASDFLMDFMDDEINKKIRGLEEVSHFFLSHQCSRNLEKVEHGVDSGASFWSAPHDLGSRKRFEGIVAGNLADVFVREPSLGTAGFFDHVEKNDKGIIVLDRDRMVRVVNFAARNFLSARDEEFRGQLFNYFIRVDETIRISIFRENRKPGVGEMRMVETEWDGEAAYLISIRDITDHLRTTEGENRFASIGNH